MENATFQHLHYISLHSTNLLSCRLRDPQRKAQRLGNNGSLTTRISGVGKGRTERYFKAHVQFVEINERKGLGWNRPLKPVPPGAFTQRQKQELFSGSSHTYAHFTSFYSVCVSNISKLIRYWTSQRPFGSSSVRFLELPKVKGYVFCCWHTLDTQHPITLEMLDFSHLKVLPRMDLYVSNCYAQLYHLVHMQYIGKYYVSFNVILNFYGNRVHNLNLLLFVFLTQVAVNIRDTNTCPSALLISDAEQ